VNAARLRAVIISGRKRLPGDTAVSFDHEELLDPNVSVTRQRGTGRILTSEVAMRSPGPGAATLTNSLPEFCHLPLRRESTQPVHVARWHDSPVW